MSRETKFGYGFLLVGCALPHLIDRLFNPTVTLVSSGVFFLIGAALLISAHILENKQAREKYSAVAKVIMLLIVTGAVLTLAISLERVVSKWKNVTPTSAPSGEAIEPSLKKVSPSSGETKPNQESVRVGKQVTPTKKNVTPTSASSKGAIEPSPEKVTPSSNVTKPNRESVRVETGIAMGNIGGVPIGNLFNCSGLTCLEEESVDGKTVPLSFHGENRTSIAILVKVYVSTDAEFLSEPRIEVATSAKEVGLSYHDQPMSPRRNRLEFSSVLLYPASWEQKPYGFIVDIELSAPIETVPLTITVQGKNMDSHTTKVDFAVVNAKKI